MTLELCTGFLIAKGEYTELAAYTTLLLDMLRNIDEKRKADDARKEANVFSELMSMTFEELMKWENKNEEEDHD